MKDFEYKVIKKYGVIADHNGTTLELNLIKWGDNTEKLDLRAWSHFTDAKTGTTKDYAKGGITLTADELRKISELIGSLGLKKSNIVSLVNKSQEIVKEEVKEEIEEEPKKDNVIQLPLPRPEIVKLVTEGNATYEQCEEKLNANKAIYVDPDSQYVIDGLLELCKVDADFRNNVMREDKDYTGVMDYLYDMCQKGYGYKSSDGKKGWIDRDLGLGLAIDYFNSEPKPKTTPKKSEPKKRGRKKKGV